MYRILILLFVVCSAPVAVAQSPATTVEQPLANEKSTEEGLRFSFKNQDWETVISWFAEQTGYSWQKKSDTDWPKGNFTLTDNQSYTPLEALDQLNYALRIQKPPYTIVRNRNQLILTEASRPLQAELIDTITPDQLDERGEYEIVRCRFSLGDIDVTEVEQDLRSSISPQYQSFAKSLPSTNEFYARETGGVLRKVRDTIVKMTKLKATSLSSYALKFYDPEQFLIVSRPLLGINEQSYVRDDGSLIITVDPANNRFILKGTPTAIKEFAEIAAVVDVPAPAKAGNVDGPYLKSYPVFTDPEIARKVIETLLDGTDATVGQDEGTGAIILRGRKEQHKVVIDTLAELRGNVGTTNIVHLENTSASNILTAVQSLMNTGTAESPQGPKLLANTIQNYIVISGSPAEIFDAERIITQLDQASQPDPNRPRTNTRMLKMAPAKRDDLLEAAEDYMRSTGRKNRLRIIMPEDRKKPIGGLRRFESNPSAPSAKTNNGSQTRRTLPVRSAVAASGLLNFALSSTVTYQPQDEMGNGAGSSQRNNAEYTPPGTATSVPGSPIVIKGTAFGILIESDDLDALDDLESVLLSEAGQEGTDQGLTVFYLKYNPAESIKSALDNMFGLGGSDSGGGGGGDLLTGIVGNMAGEGAGDLLGGILGGGGSSSSGAVISLEGTVQIGMYAPMNLLYVSGATQSDLETIQEMIDVFDQPSPPQNPELAGQFYSIQIEYRDPQEILDRIKILMADYIQSSDQPQQNQGGGGGGDAQERVAKAVRNIAGGAGGKGGAKSSKQDQPKIRLDLDTRNKQILLTGPEFIYNQVKAIVEKLDTPQFDDPKQHRLLSGGVTGAMLKIIQEQFGGKIEMVDEADEADSDAAKKNASQGSGNQSNRSGQDNAQRERQELQRSIRNQVQAGQRGGGGGQRGGGGGGRGGQRGGR